MVKGGLGTLMCAASFAIFSFIQAKENVAFEIRLGGRYRLHNIEWGGFGFTHASILVGRAADKQRIK
jgi:hypothetical protein